MRNAFRAPHHASPQQIIILRVLLHEALDELAFHDELDLLRAYGIERGAGELGADAAAAELRRHFGVDERDRIRRLAVDHEGGVAVDCELEPALRSVVAECFSHRGLSYFCLLYTSPSPRDS